LVLPTDTLRRQPSPLYLYHAIHHRRPMLNGYSSFMPSELASVLHKVQAFPEPQAIDVLNERRIRYVVLDRLELDAEFGTERVDAKIGRCETSSDVRRVPVPTDERFVLYELLGKRATGRE
jgi:hypothetical protein